MKDVKTYYCEPGGGLQPVMPDVVEGAPVFHKNHPIEVFDGNNSMDESRTCLWLYPECTYLVECDTTDIESVIKELKLKQ